MTPAIRDQRQTEGTPDVDFWRYCRKEADRRNVPAWMLAEEAFAHEDLTRVSESARVRR